MTHLNVLTSLIAVFLGFKVQYDKVNILPKNTLQSGKIVSHFDYRVVAFHLGTLLSYALACPEKKSGECNG